MAIPEYLSSLSTEYLQMNAQVADKLPPISKEILLTLTAVDAETGIKLRASDESIIPALRDWFETKRDERLMRWVHPDSLFIEDPVTGVRKARVSAEVAFHSQKTASNMVVYQAEHPSFGIVGTFTARNISFTNRSCSFSYVVGNPDIWGEGVGSAICRTGTQMLLDAGVLFLETQVNPENVASVRILDKYAACYGCVNMVTFNLLFLKGFSSYSGIWVKTPVDK